MHMPQLIDGLPAFISIISIVSLHLGQRLFDEAKEEEGDVNLYLEDLGDRQSDALLALIDDEVSQAINNSQSADTRSLDAIDAARRQSVKKCMDQVWEDAIRARNFELAWRNWHDCERNGHDICKIGFLINIALTLGLSTAFAWPQFSWALFTVVSVFLLAIPWILVIITLLRLIPQRKIVAKVLKAPIYGIPGGRRFGDE